MPRSLLVIGTGLVGTSVALAARRAGVTVYLADRDVTAARVAESLGAGLAEPPAVPVDLALIAVPPSQVGVVLQGEQRRGSALSYTDVAGVKGQPERDVLRLAPDPVAYVGGHPMAGQERSGPLAATADLVTGKTWVLSPSPRTGAEALRSATALVEMCGAVPVRLDSGTHDAMVAATSHVPHLMASLTGAGPDGRDRAVCSVTDLLARGVAGAGRTRPPGAFAGLRVVLDREPGTLGRLLPRPRRTASSPTGPMRCARVRTGSWCTCGSRPPRPVPSPRSSPRPAGTSARTELVADRS